MSVTEVTQLALAIRDYAQLAPLILIIWLLKRTKIARTAVRIIRVAAWDWLLRRKGVSESTRRKLIAEAAQRDLESS